MRALHAAAKKEDGSVLLLGIGLATVCLLALAVVTDAASVFLQRGELQARADAAVLAGAQGINLADYYAFGATTATTLDPHAARARALASLHTQQDLDPIDGFSVDVVTTYPQAIAVSISAPLRLGFLGSVITARVGATAQARLDLKTQV